MSGSFLIRPGSLRTGPFYIILGKVPVGTKWQDVKDFAKCQVGSKGLDIYVSLHGSRKETGWIRVIGVSAFRKIMDLFTHNRFRGEKINVHDPGYEAGSFKVPVPVVQPFHKDSISVVSPSEMPAVPDRVPRYVNPHPEMPSPYPPQTHVAGTYFDLGGGPYGPGYYHLPLHDPNPFAEPALNAFPTQCLALSQHVGGLYNTVEMYENSYYTPNPCAAVFHPQARGSQLQPIGYDDAMAGNPGGASSISYRSASSADPEGSHRISREPTPNYTVALEKQAPVVVDGSTIRARPPQRRDKASGLRKPPTDNLFSYERRAS